MMIIVDSTKMLRFGGNAVITHFNMATIPPITFDL